MCHDFVEEGVREADKSSLVFYLPNYITQSYECQSCKS